MSDDIERELAEMKAAERAALAASAGRFVRFAAITLASLAAGAACAWLAARWDHARKEERLARYNRGDIVVVSRGEQVTNTSPSLPLVFGAGGIAALVVFAGGAALLLRDNTYARGLKNMANG